MCPETNTQEETRNLQGASYLRTGHRQGQRDHDDQGKEGELEQGQDRPQVPYHRGGNHTVEGK